MGAGKTCCKYFMAIGHQDVNVFFSVRCPPPLGVGDRLNVLHTV